MSPNVVPGLLDLSGCVRTYLRTQPDRLWEPRGTAHKIGSHADTLAPASLGRNPAAKAVGLWGLPPPIWTSMALSRPRSASSGQALRDSVQAF